MWFYIILLLEIAFLSCSFISFSYATKSEPSLTRNSKTYANLLGKLNDVSCIMDDSTPVCITVGFQYDDRYQLPLLINTHDGGNTYQEIKDSVFSNQTGVFLSSTSYKTVDSNIFLVAGYQGNDESKATVILLQSTNGKNWHKKSIFGLTMGLLNNLSCATALNNRSLCVGVGWDSSTSNRTPILIQSIDGGNIWESKQEALFKLGFLKKVSCAPSKDNVMCVAVGYDNERHKPLVIQTNDNGIYWVSADFPFSLDDTTNFEDVSCVGSKHGVSCTIVGNMGSERNKIPVILQTNDTGLHWIKQLYNSYHSSFLSSTTCSIKDENTVCLAIGSFKELFNYGLILSSIDNGNWSKVGYSDEYTVYSSISCHEKNGFCLGIGINLSSYWTGPPVITKSLNYGIDWQPQTIKNQPDWGQLTKSQCINVDNHMFCLVVGYSIYRNRGYPIGPLLIQSNNNDNTWEVKEFQS